MVVVLIGMAMCQRWKLVVCASSESSVCHMCYTLDN